VLYAMVEGEGLLCTSVPLLGWALGSLYGADATMHTRMDALL
jgi:hypothetical protein